MYDDDYISFGDAVTGDAYVYWVGSTNSWFFNNNNAVGRTALRVGTTTNATEFRLEDNSGNAGLVMQGDRAVGREIYTTENSGIQLGCVVSVGDDGYALKGDADSATHSRRHPIGIALETVADNNWVKIATMPGSVVTTVNSLAAMSNGDPLYMSNTEGQVTNVAPTNAWFLGWVVNAASSQMVLANFQFISGTLV